MNMIFNKLSKIMFVLGFIALIVMELIIVNTENDTIEGMQGTVMFVCLIISFVFCIFGAVSFVLAIIEGLKRDKVAFLKKILSNIVLVTIAYMIPYILDYFYEFTFPIQFEFSKIALSVVITSLAIISGEYMLADHSKDNNELHF